MVQGFHLKILYSRPTFLKGPSVNRTSVTIVEKTALWIRGGLLVLLKIKGFGSTPLDRLPAAQHVLRVCRIKKTQTLQNKNTKWNVWGDMLIGGIDSAATTSKSAGRSKRHLRPRCLLDDLVKGALRRIRTSTPIKCWPLHWFCFSLPLLRRM
jgi:hypothetical protein